MEKFIYHFGNNRADGGKDSAYLLGNKGANLAEMSSMGLPIPPGFTITSDICKLYYKEKRLDASILDGIKLAVESLCAVSGLEFGGSNPLLLSVRSGSAISMPGMMDTILNLGLNSKTVLYLADKTGNEKFAYDSYRRFIQMYATVVEAADHYVFEEITELYKQDNNIKSDQDFSVDDIKAIIERFKTYLSANNISLPEDPVEQLIRAIYAVFSSWVSDRAVSYRAINQISHDIFTAATVQMMVFGNLGDGSATGVVFTRNPSDGAKELYGEYLINAQGEDIVAGIRTPISINDANARSMYHKMPEVFEEITSLAMKLEAHYKHMQDIEFTVEQGKLWILQTRNGKSTAKAAIKIAVDMVSEGLISKEQAIARIDPSTIGQLLHPTIKLGAEHKAIARGLPASPGAASGIVVLNANDALRMTNLKEKVILVRNETSPEDIAGMYVAEGILTAKGGMTSHAAVVARGIGKPCVCGTSGMIVDYVSKSVKIGSTVINAGDLLTINGNTGDVIVGSVETVQAELSEEFITMLKWAADFKTLSVRANADTAHDAKTASKFGAEGIGLCRTEHMFFDSNRINLVREMILAEDLGNIDVTLLKLKEIQKEDFIAIFKVMQDKPVNIRLLDPPLHEFLPHSDAEIEMLADSSKMDARFILKRCKDLEEDNPMLGHRGCRLGITSPQIYEMQVTAIFEAMYTVQTQIGVAPQVEIMVPLVMHEKELKCIKDLIGKIASELEQKYDGTLQYSVGTMIELPRAALVADKIAEHAEFFSFGTNDLTQTTLGISRDDAGSFLKEYLAKGIIDRDPFVTIDIDSVGKLMQIAIEKGRSQKPVLKVSICGEHGGDPMSILFCHEIGCNYVSCSPYRVPVAILAAAQAAIKHKQK